jgi:putative ABC transport system substrate-binding protein
MLTPRARHIGYLRNPSNPAQDLSFQEVLRVAQSFKVRIEPLTASNSSDLGQVLRDLRGQRLDAILVSGEITFFKERAKIAAAIRQAKLPAMFALPEYHDVGVLMSYGPSAKVAMRRVAGYVDKIPKGAKPATLPVEQISKFDFVIDLRVAREMGLKVPEELLLRADEVIR